MDQTLPACPACSGTFTYRMDELLVCPECAHEWLSASIAPTGDTKLEVIKDAVGNVLADGDTVTVINTLKVKGSSIGIKAGTTVRNIRLVAGTGDHDIDCKVDGIGSVRLKSSVVRKA